MARESRPSETLLELAHDSFPELTQRAYARLPKQVALRVQPPEAEGGALKLETRGFTFLVQPQGAVQGPAALRSADRISYGAHHLLSAGGKQGEVDGAWLAHQSQDFLLLEGGQVHRARYAVSLPEGVVALKDAGEALDFLDASGEPVLRFHYPVARDASGRSLQAQVHLLGAVPTSSSASSPPEGRLAVTSQLLTLEVVTDLSDVQGQAVTAYVWSSTASMPADRAGHLMARLPGNRALVFGGFSRSGNQRLELTSAVVYDAASVTWSFTGAMSTTRSRAAAVELPDGRVLVTGGSAGSPLATAEIYDPALGTWSAAAAMAKARSAHTATLLADGRVLVVGGYGSSTLADAELYDPASNTWSATGSLSNARSGHTATLLKDGTVLVAGGYGSTTLGAAELYEPTQGTWSTVAPSSERGNHTATLLEDGRVLLAGGNTLGGTYLSTCELYEPGTQTWSATGSLAQTRSQHAAVRLPDGRVLVVSGTNGTAETEQYEPSSGTWSSAGTLTTGPGSERAALLLGTGDVLVTGGNYSFGTLRSAELYGLVELGWELTGSLSAPRVNHTLTRLPDGRVVAMGGGYSSTALSAVEAYEPETGTWRPRTPMPQGRYGHSATLLANGRILVAGGSSGSGTVTTAWLYDPATDSWEPTGSLKQARFYHSATLLEDGRVLIAGGGGISSAELYDPVLGTFEFTGPLGSSRYGHVAVRLADGNVLLAGGWGSSGPVATAQLYEPALGAFQSTGNLSAPRDRAAGALLRNGKVLVAGGYSGQGSTRLATAELYDPLTRTFESTGSMAVSRSAHGLIELETGNVVVVGGVTSGGSSTATSELYELSTGTFRSFGRMLNARASLTLALLRTGKVLVVGGDSRAAELGPINSAPVAQSASVTTEEDMPVAVTLSGTDEDGEPLRYELLSAPVHGTLSGQAPDLTYAPAADFHGSDSLTFRVSDGKQLSAEATVSLTVSAVNDEPTAQGSSATTAEDTAVEVVLSGADIEGDVLAYAVVTGPAHGTLSGQAPALTYVPAADYHGSDSFTFRVSDGQASSAEATVSLTVTAVNDAPVAQAAQVTTAQGSAVEVTLQATDVEGDSLSYTLMTGPSHGTLTGTPPRVTYTPEPGFSGADSFTFTANDGAAQSNEATVSLTVTPVAEPPVPPPGGGCGGCTALGGEWPLGGVALLLLGARRTRRRPGKAP